MLFQANEGILALGPFGYRIVTPSVGRGNARCWFPGWPSGIRYIHFRDLLHLQIQTHTALGCTFSCFDVLFRIG